MSKIEYKSYMFTCDVCESSQDEHCDDVPYGWEANDDGHICESCLLDKELKLNLFDD